jgi:hypothetical protein
MSYRYDAAGAEKSYPLKQPGGGKPTTNLRVPVKKIHNEIRSLLSTKLPVSITDNAEPTMRCQLETDRVCDARI